jgi:hypothetical protein
MARARFQSGSVEGSASAVMSAIIALARLGRIYFCDVVCFQRLGAGKAWK